MLVTSDRSDNDKTWLRQNEKWKKRFLLVETVGPNTACIRHSAAFKAIVLYCHGDETELILILMTQLQYKCNPRNYTYLYNHFTLCTIWEVHTCSGDIKRIEPE